MKNHNLAIKLTFLAFFALAIGACFSPWQGDEGTLTLSFGDSARFIEELDIPDYLYKVSLEGPGGPIQDKFNSGSITFKLLPGKWDITVKAYRHYEDGGYVEILQAMGTKTVNVKAGKNLTETIDMYGATEVSTLKELLSAVKFVTSTEKEEIIIITEDIIEEYEFRESVNIGFDTRITLCAEKDITLTNVIFTVVDGGFLALGREGIKGNITIDGGLDVEDIDDELLGTYTSSLITVEQDGTFKMNSGIIQNNAAESSGGVYNTGIFTMNGGTIRNNKSYSGGGVNNRGIFDMNGGTISDNIALYDGGGVYNRDESSFKQNGGKIINNFPDNIFFVENNQGKKEQRYNISLESTDYGIINFENSRREAIVDAAEGEDVIVNITPNSGLKASHIKVFKEGDESQPYEEIDLAVKFPEFKMPGHDVTVRVEFILDDSPFYTITIDPQLEGGTITVSPDQAIQGQTVTITAIPLSADFQVGKITVIGEEEVDTAEDPESNTWTFTMPSADVTVSATFEEKEKYTINLTTSPTGFENVICLVNGFEELIAYEGDKITIVAKPIDNYVLSTMSGSENKNPSNLLIIDRLDNENIGTFEMPAYDVTVKVTFIETVQPSIVSVTIKIENDKYPQVRVGETLQFIADVEVQGSADNGVIWSLEGTTYNPGTTIDANGLLTVALNENVDIITVKATPEEQEFKGKAVTEEVKVLDANTYSINLASNGDVVGGSFKVVQSDTSEVIRTSGNYDNEIYIKITANDGWIFDTVNCSNSDGNSIDVLQLGTDDVWYWFFMPSSDVTVSVKFKEG